MGDTLTRSLQVLGGAIQLSGQVSSLLPALQSTIKSIGIESIHELADVQPGDIVNLGA